MRRGRRVILPFLVVLGGLPARPAFAGWSFTATLQCSGDCGGVDLNSLVPPIKTGEIFPTKSQCESTRSQVLAISVSGGDFRVFYNVTPCSGSDDIQPGGGTSFPGVTPFGAVNPQGEAEGKPQFTTHPLNEFVDLVKETQERQQAQLEASRARESDSQRIVGVGDIHGAPPPVRLPATTETEARFNEGYSGEASDFFTKLQMRQTGPGPGITSEERRLTTMAELPAGEAGITLGTANLETAEAEARGAPGPADLGDAIVDASGKAMLTGVGDTLVKEELKKLLGEAVVKDAGNVLTSLGLYRAGQEGGVGGVTGQAWKVLAGKVSGVGGPMAGWSRAAVEGMTGAAWNGFRKAIGEFKQQMGVPGENPVPTWTEAKQQTQEFLKGQGPLGNFVAVFIPR